LNANPIEVFRSHTDKLRFYPEVPSVLKDLSQKYDLIIASGTPRNFIEIEIEKIRQYFTQIFSPNIRSSRSEEDSPILQNDLQGFRN